MGLLEGDGESNAGLTLIVPTIEGNCAPDLAAAPSVLSIGVVKTERSEES